GETHDQTLESALEVSRYIKCNPERYNEYETFTKELISIQKNAFGDSDQRIINTKVELASVYEAQCRYEDAIILLSDALKAQISIPGEHDAQIAQIKSQL